MRRVGYQRISGTGAVRFVSGVLLWVAAVVWCAASPARAACVGDCGDDGEVTVDELITMVNIDLGSVAVSACLAGDADGDGSIAINEIITGVNNALNGCSTSPTPTPTPPAGSYVGDYYGFTASGQYGVRFHVDADGSADGFIDFIRPEAAASRWQAEIVDASYPASGDANLTTGAYQLSGSFFGTEFGFSGQLPTSPDASGTLTVSIFGTALEGTLSSGSGPTPTPTPGCDSADLQVTLSNTSGSFNGIASTFTVQRMVVALEQPAPSYIAGLHEVFNSTFNGTECTQAGERLRNIQILTVEVPGGLAAGQSFPVALSSPDGSPIAVVYYGEEGSGGDRVWSASAGTLFVDAVNGSVVTLRVVGAAMTQTAGAAAGSFTLDVSGAVNDFARQAP
jgi:hypothetical protein